MKNSVKSSTGKDTVKDLKPDDLNSGTGSKIEKLLKAVSDGDINMVSVSF